MSCGGRDDFEFAQLLKFAKCANDVAAIALVGLAQALKAVMIHFSQRLELFVPVGAQKLFLNEFEQAGEVAFVTFLQEWIEQHGTDRG